MASHYPRAKSKIPVLVFETLLDLDDTILTLLFLEHVKHISTSGPLYLLMAQPGELFTRYMQTSKVIPSESQSLITIYEIASSSQCPNHHALQFPLYFHA